MSSSDRPRLLAEVSELAAQLLQNDLGVLHLY